MSALGVAPARMTDWCRDLARGLPKQTIDRDGTPYLTRYFAAGWNPTTRRSAMGGIFLHRFVASDPRDAVHAHPWDWSASVILTGGYREHRCDGRGRATIREYHPGDVNMIPAGDRHRIELLDDECWTLFLVGRYQQPWRFFPSC